MTLYIDPEGLVWDVNTYVKTNDFGFSDKLEFLIEPSSIVKLYSSDFLPLCLMNDNFATFLYSRPFDELPEVFKTMGQEEKGLLLPKKHNQCLPIRRDVYELGCPYKKAISWGVKT